LRFLKREEETLAEKLGDFLTVFDTNIVIDYLKGNKKAIDTIQKYSPDGIAVTFINEYELLRYGEVEQIENVFETLISKIKVYHTTDEAAIKAAQIYKKLKDKGNLVGENDILIAGICLANKETLVTNDNDFKRLRIDSIVII
jgi:predicted nucleic acid-binding protein